jgi:predicted permease
MAIETFFQDARYALRGCIRQPMLTAVAVLTLGAGLGATLTIFTLVNAVLLRHLPVERPEELVHVAVASPSGPPRGLTLAAFRELERRQRVFASVLGWSGNGVFNVEFDGRHTVANLWAVSGTFHSALGTEPHLGRLLDERDGDAAAAVVGYDFWQHHLGADRGVIGRALRVEGRPFMIVGVTRAGFTGLWMGQAPEVTIPLAAINEARAGQNIPPLDDDVNPVDVTGRLRPGVTLEQARAHIETLWPALRRATVPTRYSAEQRAAFVAARPHVESAARGFDYFLRPRFTRPLAVLMALAGLVLVSACVHLATLLLARAASRAQELSVRLAIGASRWRLVRQALTEAVLLSAAGAAAGLALARLASEWLGATMTRQFLTPASFDFNPDLRIAAVAVILTLAGGAICGAAPAWFATRHVPAAALQRGSARIAGSPARIAGALVVVQIAVSSMLVTGAGLLARSVTNVRVSDSGFRIDGMLQALMMPRPGAFNDVDAGIYYRALVERVGALPGVDAVALAAGRVGRGSGVRATLGLAGDAGGAGLQAVRAPVGPRFFEALDIPLLGGRDLRWTDDASAPRVAVLNSAAARRLFGGQDPLGRRIRIDNTPALREVEVIGIVADARLGDVREPAPPTVFLSVLQTPGSAATGYLHVRGRANPQSLGQAVVETVDAAGRQYVLRVNSTAEVIDSAIVEMRVAATIARFFGAMALLLCAIGMFALISFGVTRRTREVGIRIALGATRRSVTRPIIFRAAGLVTAGLAMGVPAALLAGRLLGSLLYGLAPDDPLTIIATIVILIAVGAVAAWLPARRAARIEPIVALRQD